MHTHRSGEAQPHPLRIRLGRRTLLAATCRKCGKFKQGKEFGFHIRNVRDKFPYIDQRCTNCKWGVKLKGKVNR